MLLKRFVVRFSHGRVINCYVFCFGQACSYALVLFYFAKYGFYAMKLILRRLANQFEYYFAKFC